MKKCHILMLTLSALATTAEAVTFPSKPVVGVIGASYGSCQAPEPSHLAGVGLAGCSYEGLDQKLTKSMQLNAVGFRVQNAAMGGAVSYDIPAEGYRGYLGQVQQLQTRTYWFDGIQRLKYVVFTITNDCMHNLGTTDGQPCDQGDIDAFVERTRQAVLYAQNAGITVVINAYPRYQDLDLTTAGATYGLQWTIDQNTYNAMSSSFESVLSNMPGVIWTRPWSIGFHTFDGLHPTDTTMTLGAEKIAFEIVRHSLQ